MDSGVRAIDVPQFERDAEGPPSSVDTSRLPRALIDLKQRNASRRTVLSLSWPKSVPARPSWCSRQGWGTVGDENERVQPLHLRRRIPRVKKIQMPCHLSRPMSARATARVCSRRRHKLAVRLLRRHTHRKGGSVYLLRRQTHRKGGSSFFFHCETTLGLAERGWWSSRLQVPAFSSVLGGVWVADPPPPPDARNLSYSRA